MFQKLINKFQRLPHKKGELFIVGGAVRDTLMRLPHKDIDFMAVGTVADVARIFAQVPVPAHPHAPVFIVTIDGSPFEVALARDEVSIGSGSEGFAFCVSDNAEADMLRRDFTVNAMAVDTFDGELLDPFGGQADLSTGTLRRVSGKFAESPERVGRAAMIIARFGFTPDNDLIGACTGMVDDFAKIPAEQMWKQFFGKLLTSGKHFVKAFDFLEECGALAIFPELTAMRECKQDLRHHPEGDVLSHTLLAMEQAANSSLLVKATMLMHDMGKPAVTVEHANGDITAHGHEDEHAAIDRFMNRIGFPHIMRHQVKGLVSQHMRKNNIPTPRSKARLLRKLAACDVTVGDFVEVIRCDVNGRGFPADMPQDVLDFAEFAANFRPEQADKQARPLIDGNDLIAMGMKPGKDMGKLLTIIAEKFLAGELTTREDAIRVAEKEVALEKLNEGLFG